MLLLRLGAPETSQRELKNIQAPSEQRGGAPPPNSRPSLLKVLYNRTLRQLSSLPLAIGELAVIALFSAIGTIIEQNKSLDYYMKVRYLAL